MIYRNYLGLDIQSTSLRAVSLRRRRSSFELAAGRIIGLKEAVLTPGQRSVNIQDHEAFAVAVREVLDPISGGEERIAVSLPDACGRLLLLQLESPLAARDEGLDVLRWQLRDTLPADTPMQLDFQILSTDDSGRQRLVVSCMPRFVLQQYEDALAEAGFGAERILFRSLCQYNYFHRSLDAGDDFLLIIADEGTLVFQAYQDGALSYHRSRENLLSPESVFSELNRVLAGEGARLNALRRAPVYLYSDVEKAVDLHPVLESLFERPVHNLESNLQALTAATASLSRAQQHALVAAVGAAEGLM